MEIDSDPLPRQRSASLLVLHEKKVQWRYDGIQLVRDIVIDLYKEP
jgi:hypothetical protein